MGVEVTSVSWLGQVPAAQNSASLTINEHNNLYTSEASSYEDMQILSTYISYYADI